MTTPRKPGKAWVWDAGRKRWVKPAKNAKAPAATEWDDNQGWITLAQKQSNEQREANKLQLDWLNRVVDSDAELKKLFKGAVAGSWDATRFNAALTGTKWYQKHGAAWREAEVMRASQPKEYESQIAQRRAAITSSAQGMGLSLSAKDLNDLADAAMHSAWTTDQVIQTLAPRMNEGNGIVMDFGRQLRQLAAANGVQYSDVWFNNAAVQVARANANNADAARAELSKYEQDIRGTAASSYGVWADRIRAGENVDQIANAWLHAARQTLEDESISLTDKTVATALQGLDDSGSPTVAPLWKFQQDLRKDPRWMKTQNAQQTVAQTASSVLKQWGF